MNPAAALDVQDLRHAYGRAEILRGVDLQVRQGEIVTIIGPNGAGKTTLLNVLARSVRLQRGTVLFGGVDTSRHSQARVVRAGCLLVPEGRQMFATMTVRDNLLLGGYAVGRGQAPALSAVLDLFPELDPKLDQPAGTLSGGEQQMVAIGRAMMGRPSVMLLDEPSLGLAPKLVRRIMGALASLRREGLTVVLVEQNVRAALALSDRGYLLGGGVVVASGPSASLAEDPLIRSVYLGGEVQEGPGAR